MRYLINLIKKYDVKKFVFSSSASLYGNIKFKKNIKESSKLKPINPYGYSKLLNEKTIFSSYGDYLGRSSAFVWMLIFIYAISKKILPSRK